MKPPFNLIILGDPASGKGTQADKIARKYRMYDLDMGKEVKKPAVLAQYDYAKTTAIGKLTPTVVVRRIFKRSVNGVPAAQGIVFNGTPKMINEAHLVASLLAKNKRTDPLVIYIHIPMNEIFRRAAKRRVRVSGKLMRRDDDSARALKNRRRYYKEQIARVVEFFKERYEFRKISGMGREAEVAARIGAVITCYKKRYDHQYLLQ
jgi:adenylate kinase